MNEIRSVIDKYWPSGSVQRVTGNEGGFFDVAVVKFKDDGAFEDSSQLKAATDCINAARCPQNGNGAIVVVFIHGWHHNADWGTSSNDGDEHFREFRRILMTLRLREEEKTRAARGVVGIYLAWNGDPSSPWLRWLRHVPLLTNLSFWNRYSKAKKIGEGEGIREVITKIVEHTKGETKNNPNTAESPLIMIGHSMGALILENAYLSLLSESPETLIRLREGSDQRDVKITMNKKSATLPDLVLLLNSAADSGIAEELNDTLTKRLNIRKEVESARAKFQSPLVISATSSTDFATKVLWRLVRPARKTDGNDLALFTHELYSTRRETVCEAKQIDFPTGESFGQPWHCLRLPCPPKHNFPWFHIDLPKTAALDEKNKGLKQHIRYNLEPIGNNQDRPTFWVFQMPPCISNGHNDIFNFRSSLLILALMQISGTVVSLAKELDEVFE